MGWAGKLKRDARLRTSLKIRMLPGDILSRGSFLDIVSCVSLPSASLIQLHVRVHTAFFRGISGAGEDELAVAADGDAFVRLQDVAGVGDGAAVDEDVLCGDQLLRFRAAQAVDHREYGVEALRGDGAGQLLPRGFEGAGGRRHDLATHRGVLHAGEFAGDDVGHITEHEDEGLGVPTEDVADLVALDAHVHEGPEVVAVRKRIRELSVQRRHMEATDDIPLCRLFGEEALLRHVVREEHDDVPVGICTPAEDKVRRTIHRVHLAADALLPENRMKLRELGRRKEACMREIVAVIGFFREIADAALEKCILVHKSFSVLLYVRPMLSAGSTYLRGKSPAAGGFHVSGRKHWPGHARAKSLQVDFVPLQQLLVHVDRHVDAVVFVARFVHAGALLEVVLDLAGSVRDDEVHRDVAGEELLFDLLEEEVEAQAACGGNVDLIAAVDRELRERVFPVSLIHDVDDRDGAGTELLQGPGGDVHVHLVVRVRAVDYLEDQVGIDRLLERRAEGVDEIVREVVDEADGVGQEEVAMAARSDLPNGGIEGREEHVLHHDFLFLVRTAGLEEPVHERRLAGVRVADERDLRNAGGLALAALRVAVFRDLSKLLSEL